MSITLEKITEEEKYRVSMKRLADRPNSSSANGMGGLQGKELKAYQDKYGNLIADKLNELIGKITAETGKNLLSLIQTALKDENGNAMSVDAVITLLNDTIGLGDTLSTSFTATNLVNAVNEVLEKHTATQSDLDNVETKVGMSNALSTSFTATNLVNAVNEVLEKHTATQADLDDVEAKVGMNTTLNTSAQTLVTAINEVKSIAEAQVVTNNLAEGAVTTVKIANSNITADKLAPALSNRIIALESNPITSISYNATTGVLTFTPLNPGENGENAKTVDLPLELIVSGGSYVETTVNGEEFKGIQLILANGSGTINIPVTDLLSNVTDTINEIRDSMYVLQEAPPLSALSDAVWLPTPTLSQLASLPS